MCKAEKHDTSLRETTTKRIGKASLETPGRQGPMTSALRLVLAQRWATSRISLCGMPVTYVSVAELPSSSTCIHTSTSRHGDPQP